MTTLDSIREHVGRLEEGRPRSCPPTEADDSNRYFLNARRVAAALHWRLHALAVAAMQSIERAENLAAVVLARSAYETAAVIHYVQESVEAVKWKGADIEVEDKKLLRVYIGRKDKLWKPKLKPEHEAISVLTCIQRLGKRLGGKSVEMFYEDASEYCHPNWFGTIGLFHVPKIESDVADSDTFELQGDEQCHRTAELAIQLTDISVTVGAQFLEIIYENTAPGSE